MSKDAKAVVCAVLLAATLAIAGCASTRSSAPDGSGPGTNVQPNGLMNNGLTPENWNETS